jgi:lysophospholipase L1-like esterase
MMLFLTTAAAQDTRVVVTVGDGIVVAPAAQEALPGGIAAVLGDCLEERAPKKFSVVDRNAPGETLVSVQPKVDAVTALAPGWVVVTLGARELADPATDPATLATEVVAVATRLGAGPQRTVLVLGLLPAAVEADQQALDARVGAYNTKLTSLAVPGLVALDPTARGRKAAKEPQVDGGRLSAAGQARVAAAICELVLSPP